MTDCRLTHAVKWLSHDKRRGIKSEVKVINEQLSEMTATNCEHKTGNQKLFLLCFHIAILRQRMTIERVLFTSRKTAKNMLFGEAIKAQRNQNPVMDISSLPLSRVLDIFCWPSSAIFLLSSLLTFSISFPPNWASTRACWCLAAAKIRGICDVKLTLFHPENFFSAFGPPRHFVLNVCTRATKRTLQKASLGFILLKKEMKYEADTLSPK